MNNQVIDYKKAKCHQGKAAGTTGDIRWKWAYLWPHQAFLKGMSREIWLSTCLRTCIFLYNSLHRLFSMCLSASTHPTNTENLLSQTISFPDTLYKSCTYINPSISFLRSISQAAGKPWKPAHWAAQHLLYMTWMLSLSQPKLPYTLKPISPSLPLYFQEIPVLSISEEDKKKRSVGVNPIFFFLPNLQMYLNPDLSLPAGIYELYPLPITVICSLSPFPHLQHLGTGIPHLSSEGFKNLFSLLSPSVFSHSFSTTLSRDIPKGSHAQIDPMLE